MNNWTDEMKNNNMERYSNLIVAFCTIYFL